MSLEIFSLIRVSIIITVIRFEEKDISQVDCYTLMNVNLK